MRKIEDDLAPPDLTSYDRENIHDLKLQLIRQQQSSLRSFRYRSWLIRIGASFLILFAWWGAGASGMVDKLFISGPLEVADYLFVSLQGGELWWNALVTAHAAAIGLVVGSLAGLIAGVALHSWPALNRGLAPIVTLLNSLPRPALAPIFLLWFGLGQTSKVAVAVSIVFFIILLNTLAGMQQINREFLTLAKSWKLTRVQKFRYVEFPGALPSIVAGLRLAAVYSVLGVVVSEMVAAHEGLGQLLVLETNRFNIGATFGILLILAVLSVIFTAVVQITARKFSWVDAVERLGR